MPRDRTTDDRVAETPSRFARLGDAFERLRRLDGPARDEALDCLREEDSALARDVVELLSNSEQPDELLDATIVRPGIGSRIGAYRLLSILGEGGMGTVWLAEQDEPVRRTVALKLIKLGMDTRQVIRRFESERQLLARMEHPGIASIFDAGVGPDGRPFLVMELVRGEPITRYADRRRLMPAARVRLFHQVCAAVQHAHSKGVLHRDLKPSNILVTEVDGDPVPKVIDFGVAKVLDEPHDERTRWTAAGQAIGTPDYMSPEQASQAGDVDIRSDVWSLGVVLFELLTGTTPLKARSRTGSGSGHGNVVAPASDLDVPRPSVVVAPRRSGTASHEQREIAQQRGMDPAALRRLLRAELDWIVLCALETDPARRYGTVAALADDLVRALENRPVAARPSAALYELRTFARRHTVAIAVCAIVLVSLVTGLAMSLYGLERTRIQRDAAVDSQRRESQLTDRLRTELFANLIERGRLAGFADNVAQGSTLLWDAYLADPSSAPARWALRELFTRHPLRMSASYPGHTPFEGCLLDHDHLLVSGQDDPPRILELSSGTFTTIFEGSTGSQHCLDLSADGELAVTGEREGHVRLWSVGGAREIGILHTSDAGPVVARFLDGATVVVGARDGAVTLIPIDAPEMARALYRADHGIEQLQYHGASGRIATGGRDGTILLFDSVDSEPRTLRAEPSIVMSLRFSPDGTRLVSGGDDRIVRIWDVETGSCIRTLEPRNGSIRDLQFRDDATLAVLGWWRLDEYDLATFARRELVLEGGWRIVLHPDDDLVAIIGRDRVDLRLWHLEPHRLLAPRFLGSDWDLRHVPGPQGWSLIASRGGVVAELDEGGSALWSIDLGPMTLAALALSPDGAHAVVATDDRVIRVIALAPPTADGTRATSVVQTIVDTPVRSPRALAFLGPDTFAYPTGQGAVVAAAIGSTHRSTLVSDLEGEVLNILPSPDGRYVAVSERTSLVHILDRSTGEVRRVVHEMATFGMAFTCDCRSLVTGTWAGNVSMIDLSTFRRRSSRSHAALVTHIAAHPSDPDLVVSVSSDATVRFWSVSDCRELQSIVPLPNTPLLSSSLSSDGRRIVVAGSGGAMATWDIDFADAFIAGNIEFERHQRSIGSR